MKKTNQIIMANRYNNDDLEGFFRRRMSNYEETPRPEMWDRIGAAIPPKPPVAWWKKPAFWLGFVLAIVLLLSLWQFKQIKDFQKVINQQQADIEALKENQSRGYGPDNIAPNPPSVPSLLAETENPVLLDDIETEKREETKPEVFQELIKGRLIVKKPIQPVVNHPAEDKPIAEMMDLTETIPAESFQTSSDVVDFLSYANQGVLHEEEPFVPAPAIIEPMKNNPGFYFAVNGGTLATVYNNPLNRSKAEVLASNDSGFHLYNTVRDEFTVLAGIEFDNHWSLETGIGYRNNRLSLFDAQEFNYSGEHTIAYDEMGNPIGVYINSSDQTPVFRYEIINNLQSQGADIEDGDPFHLNAFFKYNNRYLSLPLWLKYRIGKRRLHVYAKTGIAWNILTVSNKNLNSSNLSNERLSLEKVQIKNDALNESFFELGFAAGLEYDFGLRTSVGLEALYYHSMASVLTTKQEAYGLSLSARYHF